LFFSFVTFVSLLSHCPEIIKIRHRRAQYPVEEKHTLQQDCTSNIIRQTPTNAFMFQRNYGRCIFYSHYEQAYLFPYIFIYM